MAHRKLDALEETGYVVLQQREPVPSNEWLDLEFMHWKSGGDTRFAPIASAEGEMECHGFWEAGKPDKDGIWTRNAEVCPTMVEWAEQDASESALFGGPQVPGDNPWIIRIIDDDDDDHWDA